MSDASEASDTIAGVSDPVQKQSYALWSIWHHRNIVVSSLIHLTQMACRALVMMLWKLKTLVVDLFLVYNSCCI